MVENNIFKFATKELSQDAFICWLVNWINIDNEENNDIKNLAKMFIYKIVDEAENIEDINVEKIRKILDRNNYKVEIERQYQRKKLRDNQSQKNFSISIDLLLIIIDKENEDKKFAIIIEDKVNTYEHDNQIERYKKGLCQIGKIDRQNVKNKDKNILGLKEDNILTCYYKVLDECRIEEKEVNFKYTRERIKKLLENYSTVKKYQYLEDYKKYVNQIEECSKGYKKESFIEAYDKYNILDEETINDIRYFSFFKELENKIFDADNQKEYGTWWGRCTIGNAPSWWCNIPIKLKFDSKGIFEKYAFIKINFKQQTGIRLKIAKKKRKARKDEIERIKDKKLQGEINYDTNGEQIYETYVTQIYKAKKIFEKIQELETEETRKCRESKELKIEKGQNRESDKKQPEMDIFKIAQIDELEFTYLSELFERIKSDLEGKTIILEDITEESQNIETVAIE